MAIYAYLVKRRITMILIGGLFAIATASIGYGDAYELDLHLHSSEVTPSEFAASDALLPVLAAAKTTRPSGTQFAFMGGTAGGPLWVLPKDQDPDLLFLSIGTEELDPADFASTITFQLIQVTGSGGGPAPGDFSVWNVGTFSELLPLMSSVPGTTSNSFAVPAGTHTHFNYGFTAPGLYNVEFTASATLAAALGGGPVTGTAVYSFGVFDVGSDYVEPTSLPWTFQGQSFPMALYGNEHIDIGTGLVAVPEPSSVVLGGLGAAGLGWLGLRRRRGGRGRFTRST